MFRPHRTPPHPVRPPCIGFAVAALVLLALGGAGSVWAQADAGANPLVAALSRHGLWAGLVLVFFGGLALNLTPCVYPMLPVTLAFFSGQARGSWKRSAMLAASYVAGIALTYAALGMLAATTGSLLGSWLQRPAVLLGVAAVIVALSLSLFGLYELRPPRALTERFGQASVGAWGAFVMGMVVGIVAAPCIGPFVLGLLLFVSQKADVAAGFLLFFVLGLGMGLPYLLLGVAANRVGTLPKAGAWLVWTKKGLGVLLIGLALYLVRSLLPVRVLEWCVVTLLAAAGVYLGWTEGSRAAGRRFGLIRAGLGVALLAAAIWVTVRIFTPVAGPGVPWIPYSDAAFTEAAGQGKPMLVDVYADWCLPCVEMDYMTFRKANVVAALAQVATLRVDMTDAPSDEVQAFLKREQVYGVPTILFFDRAGKELSDLRLQGPEPPAEFLKRLRRLEASR